MRCENCSFNREGTCGNPDSDYAAWKVEPEDGCLHGKIINQENAGAGGETKQ